MILLYLACLFPLAIYLLILAYLNRGPHVVTLAGAWDCAGVLLGISGFLLFGGPMVLNGLYEKARMAALVESSQLSASALFLRPFGQLPWENWLILWCLYFVVVALGSACLLWRRQYSLAIYNITSEDFDLVLSHVLHRRGWTADRKSGQVTLYRPGTENAGGELKVTAFPAARHVTLQWQGGLPFPRDLYEELAKTLATFPSGSNPMSSWLLGMAGGIFVTMFFGLIVYLVVLYRQIAN